MRILITGSGGMLGQDMATHLSARNQVLPAAHQQMDVTDLGQTSQTIDREKPDIVIHAAAFTAVDDCERQPALAFKVNAEGARNVALACGQTRVPMLYISTDYVFDGQKDRPYLENDLTNPLNVYGRSKLEGEKHVSELVARFWIVRTSWLFGPMGKNFVRTILKKASRGEPLRVVNDQIGSPTYTMDFAEKVDEIIQRGDPGIYHVTNQGYCSWYEFALEIIRQAGLKGVQVTPIPSSASERPAPRPLNSRLANTRLEAGGFGLLPPWQQGVRRYLDREAKLGVPA
jgi:dTDP-4-dehydrorhamnose reductase